ncbi:MAG TPA: D-alanyl-D-alanine carboxypeptidase family protein [Acetobacteraceae bacterium]|nr:D-alanyl-D-alanine carboxypeptidase family protein [Acetobacteraceae bacterium]
MLTRRFALLGATLLAGGPAIAVRAPRGKAMHTAEAETSSGGAASTPLGPLDTAARWAFAMDFNTNAELLNKAADEEMPPSSMTKLMTLYIVYSRLKEGRLKLDDTLPISEHAWRMGGSKMFVQVGEQVRVEDLIRGIEVDSGNDACIVLAEAIAGSESQFAALMNETAKKVGLTHSNFRNSTGWPDPDQHMSARDIAMLAAAIIREFPDYYHYASEKTFKYNNIEQGNRNPLVQKGTADGLKTGHTEAGGFGLAASALRGNRRVILVLNGLTSMHQRAEEGERLMDWAFNNFEDVVLFGSNEPIEQVPVWLGAAPTVPLVVGDAGDLVVTMPRNWRKAATVKLDYETPVRAPVARGTRLGSLRIAGQGVPSMQVPLVAGADVDRLGLPGRAMAVLAHYVRGG